MLGSPGPEPALAVDADLRPEGRNGPLVRTLDSYAEYYARWSQPWEAQALTRAVPAVGDAELGERFEALVDPVRWPAAGCPTPPSARSAGSRRGSSPSGFRAVPTPPPPQARPRGSLRRRVDGAAAAAPHAGEIPELRTPSTLGALQAARTAGLVDADDADALELAWRLASRVRNAVVLFRGRVSDTLPTGVRELDGVARLVGYRPGRGE
jgi:glutamate-ammonia-ligase adenylyltransferase